MAPPKIGLILCSTRSPCVGPSVASWVTTLINPHLAEGTTLEVLDLVSYSLPISPEGPLPANQPLPLPTDPYPSSVVNAWSTQVNACSGFIFVTPQYNWSFPAAVKIAIDHLYHEWGKKPALIISYGGRGGGRANDALRQVLNGVRCDPWEGRVELPIGDAVPLAATQGILANNMMENWVTNGKEDEILEKWRKLSKLVAFAESR